MSGPIAPEAPAAPAPPPSGRSAEPTASDPAQPAAGITPTAGNAARRAAFWIVAGLVAVLIALLIAAVNRNAAAGPPLGADNPAPEGAMALAEVLRQQGVDVIETAGLDATRAAVSDPAQTTILFYDRGGYLSPDRLDELTALAARVVLVDPDFDQLQALAPAVAQAGFAADRLEADCAVPAVQRAQEVSGRSFGYRIVGDAAGAVGCLQTPQDGDGAPVYSLVQTGGITVLGTVGALTNEAIALHGNAALVLGLLGEHETLIWYLPGFDDVDEVSTLPPTPAWLIPAILLLAAVGIAAAFWRGRRLGPLVIENLPVTVRASETMLGRARLYEKSRAQLRALDALRVGTVQRIAALAGLSRHATVDEVVAAAAALTGRPAGELRRLLVDEIPATDADLVTRSDELLVLEREVTQAVRGARPT